MAGGDLGVDFGTTSTVAVTHLDGQVPVPLLFDGSPSLPSAVFADRDGTLLTGQDALRSARGSPARFEPHPKRCIDDGTVLLGDREVPVPDLIEAVLSRVVTEARRTLRELPTRVRLTHPVAWGSRRTTILLDAAARAGLPNATLVPEPVAAARYVEVTQPASDSWLIYDLGAGTTDITLVSELAVAASRGLADTGGLDIDQAIVDHFGTVLARRDPEAWHRLVHPMTPAERRAAMSFRLDVRNAKEVLSRRSSTLVHVPLLDIEVPLGRETVEDVARPIVARTLVAVRDLRRTTPAPGGVVLVGGGSRMPLVATLLHRELGLPPVLGENPDMIVAAGSLLVPVEPTRSRALGAAPQPPDKNDASDEAAAAQHAQPPVPQPHVPQPERARRRGPSRLRILGSTAAIVCLAGASLVVRIATQDTQDTDPPASPRLSGAASLREVGNFRPPGRATATYVGPKGTRLVATDDAGHAWSGTLSSGRWRELRSGASTAKVIAVVFDPQHEGVVTTVRSDGAVETWSADSGISRGTASTVGAANGPVSVDDENLAVATPGGAIRIWGPYYTEGGVDWANAPSAVTTVAFDVGLVVAATRDGVLHFLEADVDGYQQHLTLDAGPTSALAVARGLYTDNRVAAADSAGRVRCWTMVYPPDASAELKFPGRPFGPDNPVVTPGNPKRTLKALATVGHGHPVTEMAFSEDGRYLATASADGTVRLWLAADGRPIATATGFTGLVGPLDLRDDRMYVTTSDLTTGVQAWQITLR